MNSAILQDMARGNETTRPDFEHYGTWVPDAYAAMREDPEAYDELGRQRAEEIVEQDLEQRRKRRRVGFRSNDEK